MTADTQKKIVEYIKLSAPMLEQHLKSAADKEAQDSKVKQLIPQVVDALVQNGRLQDKDREKAAAALQDPVRALEIMINVSQHRAPEESGLGKPSTKQASAADADLYYGGVKSGKERPSDQRWFENIGVR